MRLNYLANAIGLTMMYIGVFILTPVMISLYYGEFNTILPFVIPAVFSVIFGYLIKKCIPKSNELENLNDIKKSEALFIVAASWIVISLVGAVPYLFFGLTPLNALFESVSGITTTGATILSSFDYPHAFFFWRSFMQ